MCLLNPFGSKGKQTRFLQTIIGVNCGNKERYRISFERLTKFHKLPQAMENNWYYEIEQKLLIIFYISIYSKEHKKRSNTLPGYLLDFQAHFN